MLPNAGLKINAKYQLV